MIKNLHFSLILIFCVVYTANAQVGIETDKPTKDLDVNGELRIREIKESTEGNLRVLSADNHGNIGSKDFTLIQAEMIEASSSVSYTLTANSEETKDDIDLGLSTSITIPPHTEAFIKIYYSVPVAAPNGDSNATSNGTRFYGIKFLKNSVEQEQGSRLFRATDFNSNDNISVVTSSYSETITNNSATAQTINYALNGYVKQVPQENETLTSDNLFIFNKVGTSPYSAENWGIANLNKQVFLKILD